MKTVRNKQVNMYETAIFCMYIFFLQHSYILHRCNEAFNLSFIKRISTIQSKNIPRRCTHPNNDNCSIFCMHTNTIARLAKHLMTDHNATWRKMIMLQSLLYLGKEFCKFTMQRRRRKRIERFFANSGRKC